MFPSPKCASLRWRRLAAFVGILCFLSASAVWAQKISTWRAYKVADGLPELAVTSLTTAPQGKLLVRHTDPFLSSLDGYGVKVQSLNGLKCGKVYEGPSGQLWTVSPGNLVDLRETPPVFYPLRELDDKKFSSMPALNQITLYPIRQGRVLVLLPELLLDFNLDPREKTRTQILLESSRSGLGNFNALLPAKDGGVWLVGSKGVSRLDASAKNITVASQWREHLIPPDFHADSLENPHENDDGSLIAVATVQTNTQKIILVFDGKQWRSHESGTENIRHAWKGQGDSFWAMTPNSLLQWSFDKNGFEEDLEISARRYIDVAVESSGTFWVATSEGIYRHTPSLWENSIANAGLHSQVLRLASDQEGRIYFVSGNSLYVVRGEEQNSFKLDETILRAGQDSQAIYVLKDRSVLLGAGDKVFQFQPARKTFKLIEDSSHRKLIPLGKMSNGAFGFQRVSGASGSENASPDLLTFDGALLAPWSLPKPDGSLGPTLSSVFAAQNGDLWLGGQKGVAWLREGKWRAFVTADKTSPDEALDFAELADGRIWCATPTKIWEFDGRKWSLLRRGFESINRLQRTRDGSVWVASNNALHRYFQGNWVENSMEDGLPSAVIRDLCEDQLGHLWAATARGISQFHPEADPDPPHTSVKFDQPGDARIPEGGSLNAVFFGMDKWKFTSRGRLLYSHRLDANDWTPFWEVSFFSGADLSPGKHFLQVRSMDRAGNIDPSPARMNFAVVLPWYRESRLLFISVAALLVVLFFAGLAVNRHQRLVRSYAEIEIKVAERTRQLETANRELMHSQKMNALGTLAAGIAHDFNNILSIIKGSAQIIEANLDDPKKVSTRLDRIKTVVEQGAGIVKAMLGFSRDSEEPVKPEDINAAVEDTLKLLGDRFLREIKVYFEAGKDLPEVACSKDFIQQILLNFIFNAAESVLSRNDIILSTFATKELPPETVLAPDRTEDYVCLQVRDFGSGISRENLTRIFEPFFTTKALSARRGTGLGLSMVYELAKKVKAGIAVHSEVGVGSVFTLIIPASKVETETQIRSDKSVELARL